MPRRLGLDRKAFGEVHRQRLFAEHVLAGLQSGDHLLRVQRVRRHQEDRVDVAIGEQRGVVVVQRLDPQRRGGPGALLGRRAAGGHELRAGHAQRQVLGMALAQPAEADDADTDHNSTIRFSRHDSVAASASSSALTPSAIDVRTGAPLASASKKCAISLA